MISFYNIPDDIITFIFSFIYLKSNLQLNIKYIIKNNTFFICLSHKSLLFKINNKLWNMYFKSFMDSITNKNLIIRLPSSFNNNSCLYRLTTPIKISDRWHLPTKAPYFIKIPDSNFLYKLQLYNLKFLHLSNNSYMIYHDSTIEHINYYIYSNYNIYTQKLKWTYDNINHFSTTEYLIGNDIIYYNSIGLVNKRLNKIFFNYLSKSKNVIK
jgi:hypothetical protein